MAKRILLADDSITIQKVVELTFSDGDYEVTAVNNGNKAIQKLSEMRPDIILSDIIIYHVAKVEQGIRENRFFELLKDEIEEGRHYYESRVPLRVRLDTEIFTETIQQFVQMKREELERLKTGTQ